jgi:hypothetical protein
MIIGDELERSTKKLARAYLKILMKTKRHGLLTLGGGGSQGK